MLDNDAVSESQSLTTHQSTELGVVNPRAESNRLLFAGLSKVANRVDVLLKAPEFADDHVATCTCTNVDTLIFDTNTFKTPPHRHVSIPEATAGKSMDIAFIKETGPEGEERNQIMVNRNVGYDSKGRIMNPSSQLVIVYEKLKTGGINVYRAFVSGILDPSADQHFMIDSVDIDGGNVRTGLTAEFEGEYSLYSSLTSKDRNFPYGPINSIFASLGRRITDPNNPERTVFQNVSNSEKSIGLDSTFTESDDQLHAPNGQTIELQVKKNSHGDIELHTNETNVGDSLSLNDNSPHTPTQFVLILPGGIIPMQALLSVFEREVERVNITWNKTHPIELESMNR